MRVSKRKMKPELWVAVWERLIGMIEVTRNTDEMRILIGALLSPTEREMAAKRLMVSIMTLSGWSAYEIADELRLGTATVYKFQALLERDEKFTQLLVQKIQEFGYFKPKKEEKGRGITEWVEGLVKGKKS